MAIQMYREALRDALAEEMRRDARVFVIGEEVGRYGGAYAVTKGLFEEFGAERVVDAPISEASTVGLGVGAAVMGLRPVVELMYVDFIGLAGDQIANQMAKLRYMTGGTGEGAHGAAPAGRHGTLGRGPALAEPGGLAGARARPAGGHARPPRRTPRAC